MSEGKTSQRTQTIPAETLPRQFSAEVKFEHVRILNENLSTQTLTWLNKLLLLLQLGNFQRLQALHKSKEVRKYFFKIIIIIVLHVPMGRNVSCAINTKADSLLLIPRSPLADGDLCPAISLGMEHRTFPALQPTPYFSRCRGHTVNNVCYSSIINTPTYKE